MTGTIHTFFGPRMADGPTIEATTNELPLWYEFCDETRTSASEGGSAPNEPALRHEFRNET